MHSVIKAENLTKVFKPNLWKMLKTKNTITAIDGISFSIAKGECFGLVGESGCGKTTLGRVLLNLIDATSGDVYFNEKNVDSLSRAELKLLRSKTHLVYQDANSSLDPRYSVYRILEEPLRLQGFPKSERKKKILGSFNRVGIGSELFNRSPHELSGGQKQRLGVMRALLQDPEFIVADEPAASLDLSVQAQILNALQMNKKEHGTALLYISHNLRMMRFVSERMAVMYRGRFLETGATKSLFQNPLHPYTQSLFASLLCTNPYLRKKRNCVIVKESQSQFPSNQGCVFYPRCSLRESYCKYEAPGLREITCDHQIACHMV